MTAREQINRESSSQNLPIHKKKPMMTMQGKKKAIFDAEDVQ